MSRFTAKYDDGSYGIKKCNADVKKKLGQLEDVEEEFKIDLIKSITLCQKVNEQKLIYVRANEEIRSFVIAEFVDLELFHNRLYLDSEKQCVTLPIKGYGTLWALNKEDLK